MSKEKNRSNPMNDLEIDFKDLMLQVLKKWRVICIAAVILGILAGALGYVKSGRETASAGITISDEKKELVEKKMVVLDSLQKYSQNRQEYMESSARMQLDSENYYKGIISYVIFADDTMEADEILQMYKEKLETNVVLEDIARAADEGQPAEYYTELVGFTELSGKSTNIGTGKMASFHVNFWHNSEKVCEAVLNELENKIAAMSDEILQERNGYEVEQFGKEIFQPKDHMVSYERQAVARTQVELLNLISGMEKGMSEEEAAYYKAVKNSGAEESVEAVSAVPEISVKYIVLGILAGGVLMAVWYALFYLIDGRVHTKADVRTLTDSEVFAVCKASRNNKKKLLGIIDAVFDKMIAKRDGFGNSPEMLEFQLGEYARKENIQELYIIGSRMDGDESAAAFAEQLKPEGISVKLLRNFMEDAEARKAVLENGHVVLMETLGKTGCRTIQEESRLLRSYGVKLAGVVLLR